jgi:phosphate transport system substrate-binding protein
MRILAGLGLLGLAGCEGPEQEQGQEEASAPTLKVAGSEAMLKRLVPALLEPWKRRHPDVVITTEVQDAAVAIRGLSDRNYDLVASTRDARPSEDEQAQVLGYSLRGSQSRHIVAVDVVAAAVHQRSKLEALTYDQVIGVFCSRSIDNWSFLGSADRPIRVVVPDLESGDRALFEDFFCGPKGFHRHVEVATDEGIRQALGSDESVISFVSASDPAGKLLALQADADLLPVRPTQDQIIRGAYPLYKDLYLFTRGTPTGLVADFLRFVESPAGQEVVDEQRLVPLFLRPERMDDPRPLRETIHFDPGSSAPDQRSMARLNLLVQELRERKLSHVVLEGYTDDQEPDAYRLSEQRATTVRQLLATELPDLYFEIIPRGPKAPLAPNETPFGRQVNRRVQIYLGEDEQATKPSEAAAATPPAEEG